MDRPSRLRDLRSGGRVHAAIDLGTNSFHLLVARVDEDGHFDVLATEKEMVRLGSGSGDMALLSESAMSRGIGALRRFRQLAESFDASVTAVATSALREADNRDEFISRARAEVGVDVDVISGVEEARLIHLGVIQALPVFDDQVLVVDIGGGSTEFVVGRGREVRSAHSTKLGAIRLTDRFFPGGIVKAKAVRECRTHIRSMLVPTIRRVREFRPFLAVGSSGTISTVARMVVANRGGDPAVSMGGIRFTADELARVIETIVECRRPEDRAGIGGLDERRRDIIAGGAILLEQILDGLALEEMTVSDAALREGVLLDLASRSGDPTFHHLSDIRRESVLRMADLYHEDPGHIERATDLSLILFDALGDLHALSIDHRDFLEAAGLLHNVGLFISHAAHHKHSYYVIRNSDQLAGFTDQEIELIAQVARYHRKSSPKRTHPEFESLRTGDKRIVRILAGILRIGIALDRTRQGGIEHLEVDISTERIEVRASVRRGLDYSLEQYTANQRIGLLERALKRSVHVVCGPVQP